MIKLTVSNLTTVQADKVIRALDKYPDIKFERTYTSETKWSIASLDRHTASLLALVLTDEDSGADYLV